MDEHEIIRQAEALAIAEGEALSKRLITAHTEPVVQKVVSFYRRMDGRMDSSPTAVDCKDGCSYCCYYHVLVTPAEAIAIAEHIEALPEPRRTELRNAVADTAARVASLSEAEYIRINIRCAFLRASSCSIYSVRPTACRGFHSRDVGVCKRAFDNPQSNEPNPYDPNREVVKIGYRNAVLVAQHRAHFDATSYEMHGAVNEALNNRAVAKRWRAGKLSFPTVKDRTSVEDMVRPQG